MEDFALEINKGITKLIESSEEIEDKFKEHFKDIEDDGDYSKYHEDYDGLSEEHHEWVKGALLVGGAALTVAVFATGVGEAATLGIVAEGAIGASEAVEGAEVVTGVAEGVEVTAEAVEVGETTTADETVIETEASAIEIETVSINELPKNVQDSYKNYTEYRTKKGKSPWNNNARPEGGKAGEG